MTNSNNKFMEVVFHKSNRTLEFIWLEKTLRLTDQLFRKELERQIKWVKKYKPANILMDTTQFVFPIAPLTQTWVNDQVFCTLKQAGVNKIGFLKPTEFISRLSVQQTIEAHTQRGLKTRFFDTRETALKWLVV